MVEVQEMSNEEIEELLQRVGYGHLACVRERRPYVVPIHYSYDKPYVYIYTTEGMKSEIIGANPQVCLQIEEIVDEGDWRSVVVNGEAEQITDATEREKALKLILSTNPTLTPAISIRWMDNWIRENREVVYRILPDTVTGRSSLKVKINAAFAQSGSRRKPQIY